MVQLTFEFLFLAPTSFNVILSKIKIKYIIQVFTYAIPLSSVTPVLAIVLGGITYVWQDDPCWIRCALSSRNFSFVSITFFNCSSLSVS